MNLIQDWYKNVVANWRSAYQDAGFRRYFPVNFLVCFLVHFSIVYWLKLNSGHPGMLINDPIYGYLPPRDFSPVIFFFTYSSTILIILYILQYPLLMQRGFVAFVMVFFVRAICIHLIPLSPSPGIIPLNDPVTDFLADEGRIMNDLFFSGHVADLTTFALLCYNRKLRAYIILSAFIVGSLLIWQRVHYTIDVLMAPAFSYLSYWLFVEKDLIWGHFLKKPAVERSQGQSSAA